MVDRPITPRYFAISSEGPSWLIVAASPLAAWRLWLEHLERGCDDLFEETEHTEVGFTEFTADFAERWTVLDNGIPRPFTACAIGSVNRPVSPP